MGEQLHRGTPLKGGHIVFATQVGRRVWNFAVNFKSMPYFLNWKVYLANGELRKANYSFSYLCIEDRFTLNQECKSFMEEFDDGTIATVMAISRAFKSQYDELLEMCNIREPDRMHENKTVQ